MPSILIVGATRGLGRSLVTHYSSNPSSSTQGTPYTIYATTRSSSAPTDSWATKQNIHWLLNVDLEKGPEVAEKLAKQIEVKADVYKDGVGLEDGSSTSRKLGTVIITAGYFATEDFGKAKWEEEVRMYTLSSVAPVFVVEALSNHGLFIELDTGGKEGDETGGDKKDKKSDWTGTKVILVSSESGSITLRHEQEGGGNFAHHGSKAALNMVGKQLSFDLKGKGVGVGIVHPRYVLSCGCVGTHLSSPLLLAHHSHASTPALIAILNRVD